MARVGHTAAQISSITPSIRSGARLVGIVKLIIPTSPGFITQIPEPEQCPGVAEHMSLILWRNQVWVQESRALCRKGADGVAKGGWFPDITPYTGGRRQAE